MKLQQLIDAMEQIAPTGHAEAWDNVGLLVGDPDQPLKRTLLTIDYTTEVAAEAKAAGCSAVIAYHPPIFEPLKRVTTSGGGALIHDAIRRGVAIYSPHTALDIAEGGTNDMLADAIGLTARQPLRLADPKSTQCKLVVFVQEENLDAVSSAIFAAGAGRIGKYSSCSFQSPGTGTFFGEEGSDPAVGQSGRLETSSEVRLETVVPIAKVQAVISALRESHSYEEPAFDLNQLAATPEGLGLGRIGDLTPPVPANDLLKTIKRQLEIDHLLVAGPTDRQIHKPAVCALRVRQSS